MGRTTPYMYEVTNKFPHFWILTPQKECVSVLKLSALHVQDNSEFLQSPTSNPNGELLLSIQTIPSVAAR